jgi:hypothetical protein
VTKEIPLTQGKIALADDEDYEWLSRYSWHVYYSRSNDAYYAIRNQVSGEYQNKKNRRTVYMHRAILNVTDSALDVDHINMNTLDNRKENLRIATRSQNQFNRNKQSNNTSGYKGVYWHRQKAKWDSIIIVNKKRIFLGSYSTPEEAYNAYREAALEMHGEFIRLEEM